MSFLSIFKGISKICFNYFIEIIRLTISGIPISNVRKFLNVVFYNVISRKKKQARKEEENI